MVKKQIKHFVAGAFICTLAACGSVKNSVVEKSTVIEPQRVDLPALSDKKRQEFEFVFIEALKQKRVGNLDKAVGFFSNCLEIDPKSAAAMYELSNIYIQRGDFTSAMLLLEKAVKINPNNDWYKILLAQIYQKNKEFDSASKLFTELAQKNPDNLNFLYLNAILLKEAKQYDRALEQYDKLQKKVGAIDQLIVEKQKILLEKGDNKGAIQEINNLIKSNKKEPKYYGLMADLYLTLKDREKALEYYQKVLEVEPDNGFVHLSLANYWFAGKNKEKALEEAKKGLINKKLETANKLRFFEIMRIEKDKHGLTDDELASLLTMLMSSDSKDVGIYAYYIDYLLEKTQGLKDEKERKKKYKEVRIHLRRFVKLHKADPQKWNQLLLIENDLQDTVALYNESLEALKYHSKEPLFYILNAFSAMQQEKYDEAMEVLNKGEKYADGKPALKAQFPLNRAEIYFKQKKKKEAFEAFDQALLLNPNDYMALNNYAYYLSLEKDADFNKAEKMSAKVIAANPTNSTYLDTYAWILFKKKDYRLAKFYMESALSNGGSESGVLIEHYGDILFHLDKVEEAVDNWKKAKEKGVKSETLDKKIKDRKYYEEKD
ncbi:tetratricopeptide repeat protein [Prolixibacteraceae bacterium JC049]|nr:tetratricopeptide repeat protein [Prolixibacteraceae bacterium JC049]